MPMSYPSSATTNQTRGSGTNGTHYKVRSRLNVLLLKSITKFEKSILNDRHDQIKTFLFLGEFTCCGGYGFAIGYQVLHRT
jgi:hypothetical protein